jgi:alkanesulfonate monooxygenase SsuD/methylene tetrahydromethanopterin reductase-like flavin-dependent oxidoreductase (luciferase family)
VKLGALLWSQASDWPAFEAAAVAAEAAGWDSLWTWDHLQAINGPADQPIFEGWLALAALAARTSRIRLGLMVGANTFRNPGHTAKLAVTLDHLSRGRAVLGLGAANTEREHDAFGMEFGRSPGERLDWLAESVGLIRRLLDGERFSAAGPRYRFHDAFVAPRPLQAHLPILIGGGGPKKTLPIVARHADAWNVSGSVDELRGRAAILAEHCAAVGRDPATIERSASFLIVLRDSAAAAEAAHRAMVRHNGMPETSGGPILLGSPDRVAEVLRPYVEIGFETIIVRLPTPYDAETIGRMGEVRTALDR